MNPGKTAERIRTLIVDDEPLARSSLRTLLHCDPQIEIIGECSSGEEAIVEIRRTKPDLVFLDVQMPECDGFDVLERLGSDAPAAVVFVTAYDRYALRAFDAAALDYLLKPFDNARFARALDRAKAQVMHRDHPSVQADRIAIKSAGQVLFLKISDIDWIEAADYYSCLHIGARSHLLRRSMAELERELNPENFCRVHRSAIVQLDRVESLKINEDGEYDILLKSGDRLRMSRKYRKLFQARLGARSLANK